MIEETDWLEYFAGGVPTGEFFRLTLDDVRKISSSDKERETGINRLQELCFIGLVSYFEGFCKDLFACLINIEPRLISNLKASGQNVDVDASRVALYKEQVSHRLGFILTEGYDFGTAQKVNALYGALLKVSPFGSDDAKHYGELLRDRNLFVHHGGTFTLSYLEQKRSPISQLPKDAYFNSQTLTPNAVQSAIKFIEGIARKSLRSSHDAVLRYLTEHGFQYQGERKKALEALLWWGDTDP